MEVMNSFFQRVDDAEVLFVLGMRKGSDGGIEYLVRRRDKVFDRWEPAANLTCGPQIMRYYEGQNPRGLTPNLEPEQAAPAPAESVKILAREQKDNVTMLRVQVAGEEKLLTVEEVRQKYPAELVAFGERSTSSEPALE